MFEYITMNSDIDYMRLALQLASAADGQTEVNPLVGCVLVKDGRLIGMGAHLQRGQAHAEVHALQMAGERAFGSTAYVTLEPCSHTGKTGPCCEALVRAGVSRVVIAALDPNPLVSGQGMAYLSQHGVKVEFGICEKEAIEQQEHFRYSILAKMPFVTCKVAATLDGKIATISGDSRWITNELSRQFVHHLRHTHQAIMVGIETVLADDPQLSARLPIPARQPIRIVIDSKLRIPMDSKLVTDFAEQLIIFTTDQFLPDKQIALQSLGVRVFSTGAFDQVDLYIAMKKLYEIGVGSVLLEGGSRLNGAMLESGLIQKVHLFYAPKWIGGANAPSNFHFTGRDQMAHAIQMNRVSVRSFENDICITGYPIREGVNG